jgi:imidazolonepropionase-like amidohydrolase
VDSADAMRVAVRDEIKNGVRMFPDSSSVPSLSCPTHTHTHTHTHTQSDWIKLLVTGAFMTADDSPKDTHFSSAELSVCQEECSMRLQGRIMAHAHGAQGIQAALQHGARSIEHASFIDDQGIAMAKQTGAERGSKET